MVQAAVTVQGLASTSAVCLWRLSLPRKHLLARTSASSVEPSEVTLKVTRETRCMNHARMAATYAIYAPYVVRARSRRPEFDRRPEIDLWPSRASAGRSGDPSYGEVERVDPTHI